MNDFLKNSGRIRETIFLLSISAVCFSISLFRFIYTDTKAFLFLNWNLFLAFLPWFFSTVLIVYPILQKMKICVFGIIGSWLLFFPNAPYILTDLFHLRAKSTMPLWFDLVLILSFAWVGLLYGYMSLWNIEKVLSANLNKNLIPVVSMILLFFGSFGIYLGRYLRWNSWDIINKPLRLFNDISDRVIDPVSHLQTWGMTFFMFVFLCIIYWSFRYIKNRKD